MPSASAPAAAAPAATPAAKRPFKEWTADEVREILAVFKKYDADGNGSIDESELKALCAEMKIEASMADADTFVSDGVVDPLEFFAFYVGE